MTNQEAFDKMMNHLRSLSGQSVNSEGECVYNCSMCAIGRLLTDEEQEAYGDSTKGVRGLLNDMTLAGHTSALHSLDVELLNEMQATHDDKSNWDQETGFTSWGEQVAEVLAEDYGLTYTKP